ncbi:hypothetical protein [Pedobacter agri]|uniref:DUF3945 domain-containing protein n=1 Tax=Pedobacter agri TaxID=454586 RepID=A0A9X3I8R2_9SPHI|nr:hypothetical protein [Pedobacter agri]MCX3265001.1 hypothetical protein [Pedobacter agri]
MNEENLGYLQNNLKYLGFGEQLNAALKESIGKALPEFKLETSISMPDPVNKDKPELADKMSYALNFSRSKETNMYFFNNFEATLQRASGAEPLSQVFYINKGKGVTAKESFNLLSDRSVNKDVVLKSGEKANLWLKLDFGEKVDGKFAMKNFGEKYGFDLSATIDRFMIADLEKPGFKDQLMKSLQRGNVHEVSFSKDGREIKGFVAANPQYKTLDFYDAGMKSVYSKAVDQKEVAGEAVVQEPEVVMETKKGRGR